MASPEFRSPPAVSLIVTLTGILSKPGQHSPLTVTFTHCVTITGTSGEITSDAGCRNVPAGKFPAAPDDVTCYANRQLRDGVSLNLRIP
jgi:hypothetical protein